jgi:lipoic acid synthetase
MTKWHKFSQNHSYDKKPNWIKKQLFQGEKPSIIRDTVQKTQLQTVCEEARCPNRSECWSEGTATIMVMGDVCTRGCKFCSVKTGQPLKLDLEEPNKVAQVIDSWKISYLVLTMVDRDDLPDGGIHHLIEILKALRLRVPEVNLEILTGDFQGKIDPLVRFLSHEKHTVRVFAHNLETVRRLSLRVRDRRASFDQSLAVLKKIKEECPFLFTKSSLMLGLGETDEDIEKTFEDLRNSYVDLLTLGQYLQPTKQNLKVKSYIDLKKFDWYKMKALDMKFQAVEAGPFVRSSYKAGFLYKSVLEKVRP